MQSQRWVSSRPRSVGTGPTSGVRFFSTGRGQTHGLHEHLKVVPGFFLRGRVAEQEGGVVGDDGGDVEVAVPAAAEPAQRKGRVEQGRGGDFSEDAEEL